MKVNDMPMVPMSALERAQGELKSAYCQIADLHADIEEQCQEIDRLRLEYGLVEEANAELEKRVYEHRERVAALVDDVKRLTKAKKGAKE